MLQQGDLAAARTFHEDSLRLSRELGNQEGIARALGRLSVVAHEQGDAEGARALLSESLAASRTVGDWVIMVRLLSSSALVLCARGDYATAGPVWAECLQVCRDAGHVEGAGEALAGLGLVAYGQGHFAAARTLYLEALGLLPAAPRCGYYLMQLAGVELELARLPVAQQDSPAMVGAQLAAPSLLPVAVAGRVVRLLGAGKELLETQASGLGHIEWAIYEFSRPLAQDMLGMKAFEAAYAQGQAMTVEQVHAYALEPAIGASPRESVPDKNAVAQPGVLEGADPPPYLAFKRAAGVPAPHMEPMAAVAERLSATWAVAAHQVTPRLDLHALTAREAEVLRLLATSLTDHQIAERLVVSKRTVQAHIRSIYSKLDIPNRSAATRYAIEHGLV
jgi:DNA-binding CsgD family transcriptional regulator